MPGRLWRPVAACAGLWRAVAACGGLWRSVKRELLALLERLDCGALEPGGLEAWGETGSLVVAMMMRPRIRMLMNDDKDED